MCACNGDPPSPDYTRAAEFAAAGPAFGAPVARQGSPNPASERRPEAPARSSSPAATTMPPSPAGAAPTLSPLRARAGVRQVATQGSVGFFAKFMRVSADRSRPLQNR